MSKHCIECQQCCRNILVPLAKTDFTFKKFYKTWGLEIVSVDGYYDAAVVPHPCQHITEDGCAIYADRPQVCRDNEEDVLNDPICKKGKWNE